MRLTVLAAALAFAWATPAMAQLSEGEIARAREAALDDLLAWEFVEGITTEVGPRLAGTEAEARGRAWAMRWLASHGFANLREEPFEMTGWVRGVEEGAVVAPFVQPLRLAAIGGSGSTGDAGIDGELVILDGFAALQAAPASELSGKIVLVTHRMPRTQEGWGYGVNKPIRKFGPAIAAAKGAKAMLLRSVGTSDDRFVHVGDTVWGAGQTPIPVAALPIADAENVERMAARGGPLRVRLRLTPRTAPGARSANITADVAGSDPQAGIVLVACHLDSWDLGTGAVDDATGCGIVSAAAARVAAAGQPRRTIRLLMAGAEEFDEVGARAFAKAHGDKPFVVALESDFGFGAVWRVDQQALDPALFDAVAAAIAPLGVLRGIDEAYGGPDTRPVVDEAGSAIIQLKQDGIHYFDVHHTANDTLDQVDRESLAQNVAAWTATLVLVANWQGAVRATTPAD